MTAQPTAPEPALRPECPFCGSDRLKMQVFGDNSYSICCEQCSTYGPLSDSKRKAMLLWNTRAVAPEVATHDFKAADTVLIPALFVAYQGQHNEDAKVIVVEANGKQRALWVLRKNLRAALALAGGGGDG